MTPVKMFLIIYNFEFRMPRVMFIIMYNVLVNFWQTID